MIVVAAVVGFGIGWVLKGDTLWSVVQAAAYWRGEALAYEREIGTRGHTVPWRVRCRPILAEPWPLRLVRRITWPGWPREGTAHG